MFESLIPETGRTRQLSHPVLSLALHAGILVLVTRPGNAPSVVVVDPLPGGPVIWVPDGPGTASKVGAGPRTAPSRPVSEHPVFDPGSLPVIERIGGELRLARPGTDVLTRLRLPGIDEGARGPAGPYQESELSDAPVVVEFPDPVYPPALRAAGIEGAVQVTYVVSPAGGVEPETITIVSTDHLSLATAVREALVRARFRPGRVRGTPVRSLVRQTIRFSLMSL